MVRVIFMLAAYILLSAVIFGIVWLIAKLVSRLRKPEKGASDLTADFRKLAKWTKIKRWTFAAWLASVVVVLLTGIAGAINSNLMENAFWQTNKVANNFLAVEAPNVDGNNLIVNEYGTFSSNLHADTFKNLDGYHVDWQDYDWHYGTLGAGKFGYEYQYVSPVFHDNAYYTQGTNQKIASFFATGADYTNKNYHDLAPTHEAKTLSNLPNHLAEVAVTFDKPYTYAEIQKMIPSNLMINWYWIGVNDLTANSATYFGLASDPSGNSGKSDPSGELTENSYDSFVSGVKEAQKYNQSSYNNFSPAKDALKQVEKYPTLSTAKFSGLILTGRTENLAVLDSEKWAFATNVGLTTEILPYQTPVK